MFRMCLELVTFCRAAPSFFRSDYYVAEFSLNIQANKQSEHITTKGLKNLQFLPKLSCQKPFLNKARFSHLVNKRFAQTTASLLVANCWLLSVEPTERCYARFLPGYQYVKQLGTPKHYGLAFYLISIDDVFTAPNYSLF